jgi:putative transposase
MRSQTYPSDLTDAQWQLIEPHLPVYPAVGREPPTCASWSTPFLYLLRTGCQWRYLSKDFPPKSTV